MSSFSMLRVIYQISQELFMEHKWSMYIAKDASHKNALSSLEIL
jgi:hypothetical protein